MTTTIVTQAKTNSANFVGFREEREYPGSPWRVVQEEELSRAGNDSIIWTLDVTKLCPPAPCPEAYVMGITAINEIVQAGKRDKIPHGVAAVPQE